MPDFCALAGRRKFLNFVRNISFHDAYDGKVMFYTQVHQYKLT